MAITFSNISIASTSADSLSTVNGTLIVASDIAGTTAGGALTLGTPSAGTANLLTLANTRGLSAGEGAGISFVDNNTAGTGIERASIHMLVEGSPYNGAIKFSTGLGTAGTYNTGTMTERMRITGSGGISFGSSGTAYGTSGQVLTSNGNAAPTWQAVSAGTAAAGTLTGTTLASNVVTSSLTTVGTLSALAVTGTTTHTGAFNLAGASSPLQVGGSAGTSGYVLTSAGAGTTPTWAAASGGGVIGTTTQVAFNSAGTMTGNGDLTFSGQTLSIGVATNNNSARLNVTGLISSGPDGGNCGPLTIRPGVLAGNATAYALTLTGGTGARAGGAVNITGGAESTNGYGAGAVNITGGGGFGGTGYAGGVTIAGGVGTTQQGAITLNTAGTIRLQVTGTGAWSVGTSGTAYGTSGQVLTSNGNAPPTWQAAGAAAASTLANATTLGTVTNTATSITPVAGTTPGAFTITQATSSSGTSGIFTIAGGSSSTGAANGDMTVRAGDASGGNSSIGGALILRGGNTGTAVVAVGGTVTLQGGSAGINSGSVGGAVTINGGLGGNAAAAGGAIILQTAASAAGTTLVTRMTIANTGAITFSGWHDTATTTFAASLSINCALVNAYRATLTANTTAFAFTNVPASGKVYAITLFLTQDATGSRTMTWPTGTKWTGGVTPTLTTTATKTDIFTLTTPDGGTTWYGVVVGQNY